MNCAWGRHCDESRPAPFPKWAIAGVIESTTCLLPMITERSMSFLRLYRHYKNGWLPYTGGLLDQPNIYLEAMEIIDAQVEQK